MKKKFVAVVACVMVLCFALVGCTEAKKAENDVKTDASKAETKVETTIDDVKAKALEKGTLVVDDEICTIIVEGPLTDAPGVGYTATLINNSDKTLQFTAAEGGFTVGGEVANLALSETVDPGKHATDFMWVEGFKTPDELKDVKGTIEVWDKDANQTLGTYLFTM